MREFGAPRILWMPDVSIPSKMDHATIRLMNISKYRSWHGRKYALDKELFIEVYLHSYFVQQPVVPIKPVIIMMYDMNIVYTTCAPA
jgi:hypothetical protein